MVFPVVLRALLAPFGNYGQNHRSMSTSGLTASRLTRRQTMRWWWMDEGSVPRAWGRPYEVVSGDRDVTVVAPGNRTVTTVPVPSSLAI